jgi:hypothetical protein
MFSEMGIHVVEAGEASGGEEQREEPDEEAESESSELVETVRAVPAKSEAKPTEHTAIFGPRSALIRGTAIEALS